jgi:hypothetical protein
MGAARTASITCWIHRKTAVSRAVTMVWQPASLLGSHEAHLDSRLPEHTNTNDVHHRHHTCRRQCWAQMEHTARPQLLHSC